jgi:hypothetical protein
MYGAALGHVLPSLPTNYLVNATNTHTVLLRQDREDDAGSLAFGSDVDHVRLTKLCSGHLLAKMVRAMDFLVVDIVRMCRPS